MSENGDRPSSHPEASPVTFATLPELPEDAPPAVRALAYANMAAAYYDLCRRYAAIAELMPVFERRLAAVEQKK